MGRIFRIQRQTDGGDADDQTARTAASELVEAMDRGPAADPDTVIHRSPWKAWVAVREDCFIRIYDEVSGKGSISARLPNGTPLGHGMSPRTGPASC